MSIILTKYFVLSWSNYENGRAANSTPKTPRRDCISAGDGPTRADGRRRKWGSGHHRGFMIAFPFSYETHTCIDGPFGQPSTTTPLDLLVHILSVPSGSCLWSSCPDVLLFGNVWWCHLRIYYLSDPWRLVWLLFTLYPVFAPLFESWDSSYRLDYCFASVLYISLRSF